MSLRTRFTPAGNTEWTVICNGPGCDVTLDTTDRYSVLAFYTATLRHGWQGSDTDHNEPLRRWCRRTNHYGVFCPACIERILSGALDDIPRKPEPTED
jgi:hypothetical protein